MSGVEGGDSKYEFVSLLLGVGVALFILVASSSPKKVDYGDAATFGAATSTMMASYGGHSIHCHALDDANNCIKGVNARGANSSILWLGNSQIHAVNQAIGNDQTAVPELFESMKAKGLDLVVFSQPNANLQEHWILFEYLLTKLPIKKLILPVVFDDTREEGLRKEIADALIDPEFRKNILTYDLGKKLFHTKNFAGSNQSNFVNQEHDRDVATYKSDSWLVKFNALFLNGSNKEMLGEGIESYINTFLDKHSALWRARPDLRAQVIYGYLYTWRNIVFGITPNTKRKVIRGRYQDNMEALRITLETASKNNIEVYVYIAPIRNDVSIPYDNTEYTKFKNEVEAIAVKYKSNFINYEDLIAAEYWGEKGSTGQGQLEIDFMHFQAKGHKVLAKNLAELIK